MDEPQAPSHHFSAPAWASILDDVAHPAALLDGSGRVLRANAFFARACGLEEGSCQGLALSQARPDLWQVLAPLLSAPGQKPRSARWEFQASQSAPVAFQATVREVQGGEARSLLWLSLRAEEAPEDSRGSTLAARDEALARAEYFERRYRLLSESIPQIVWAARPEGVLSFINRRGVEYFGIDPDTADGALWSAFLHPDDVEPTLRLWAQAVENHLPFEVRYRLRRHDNSYRWFLGLGRELPAQDGLPAQWVGTCTDIDAPKRAEESLRLLADAGEILTSSLDESRPLQGLAQRLVLSLADWCSFERVLPDGRFEMLAAAHADPEKLAIMREMRPFAFQKRFTPGLERVLATGQPEFLPSITDEMLDSRALDPQYRKYLRAVGFSSLICVPLSARGEVLGVLTLVRGSGSDSRAYEAEDLALAQEVARRAAQSMDNAALYRQAQRALQAAEEAGHAKDSFLATVSHELRTPLTAILGWANLLKSGRVNAEMTRSALETIERNVKAQAQIVEDLLDVSRIVAGKLVLEMKPVELTSIVAGAIEAVRPAIDAKNIVLLFGLRANNGAPAVVSGDAVRLQQVVWNILSNAVKFTPRGGRIEVTIGVRASQVVLTVHDSGPGVSPEFAPYLFERFRQADSSSTRRHGGLGLGLAIVRHLVEMHGGNVRLEPSTEGACFVVELPVLEVARDEVEKPRGEEDAAGVMLQGRSVLVVEDEADSRELLLVVLGRFGARVRGAASAFEAWEALGEEKPDVLVSDIGMPDEDGYSLIRRVRARFSSEELPAIALTAYAAHSDRERALAEGFDAHITKPASPIHLAMSVAALLEPRRGPAS